MSVDLTRFESAGAEGVVRILRLRLVLELVLGVVAVGGAVLLFRKSINLTLWGPFIAGDPVVTIRKYSSPWVLGAAGALLFAGLLVVFAVKDLVRVRRLDRAQASAPKAG